MQFPDSEFWDFSIEYYSICEVEKNCLKLQDQFDLNVNLILFCYWLATKNHILNKEQWQQVLLASQPWEEVIKPLRLSRKMMKDSSIAWPSDFKLETKKSVSSIEINTEHMQQLSIEQTWQKMNIEESGECDKDIVNNNVQNYLTAIDSKFTADTISNETDILLKAYMNYQENNKTIAL